MDQFIVAMNERPFAYLQCCDPQAWPENGLGLQPGGTRGIDQFIGEADMLDRGHGSALIRDFVDALLRRARRGLLPIPTRLMRARCRAYENAGLRRERFVQTPDGRALLMVRDA